MIICVRILSEGFPKDQFEALPSPLEAAKLVEIEKERLVKSQAELARIQKMISEEEARIKEARRRCERAAKEAEKQEAIARSRSQGSQVISDDASMVICLSDRVLSSVSKNNFICLTCVGRH